MATTQNNTRLRAPKGPAEQVSDCEDLIIEILLRVPAKNLLKMKLVSKPWLSLIASPYFTKTHIQYRHKIGALKPQALFLDVIYTDIPTRFKVVRLEPSVGKLPVLNFIDTPRRVRILQSCTGVLLCKSKGDDGSTNYFICNPVINKVKLISFPDSKSTLNNHSFSKGYKVMGCKHVGVNFAFDPLKSPHYKILSIWRQELEVTIRRMSTSLAFTKYSIDLYSSETNSWRVSKSFFRWTGDIKFDLGVYLNGAIHWNCTRCRDWVYYDLDDECVKKIPSPPTAVLGDREHSYLGQSGGRLHLIVASSRSLLRFSIFELHPDYSSWLAMHDINLDAFVPRGLYFSQCRTSLMSCSIQREEESGELKLIVTLPWGSAISYNLEQRRRVRRMTCSNINFTLFDQIGRFRVCCPYFETLSYIEEESCNGEASVVFGDKD